MDLTTDLIRITAIATAGTVGGFYSAFSLVVMPALDRLGDTRATETMNHINVLAETPPFLGLFFGSAVAAGALAVLGGIRGDYLAVAGGVAVLAGTALTVAYNVPLNNRLASGVLDWAAYRGPWTAANSVRGLLCVAGAVALAAPLLR
ncbi:anthrone oxygenase family protein [Corynebacterium sp. A21]|uniref:anthrone oxygenase family protein n=1 Tax=Corynebacterium sp. A21 TaxID=3457318 RepID=UPI003FD2C831